MKDTEEFFQELAEKWRRETGLLSLAIKRRPGRRIEIADRGAA